MINCNFNFASERAETAAKVTCAFALGTFISFGVAKALDSIDRKANEQCDEDCCCEAEVVDPTVGI